MQRSPVRAVPHVFALALLLATATGASAVQTSVHLFNVNPTTLYAVNKNGVPATAAASSEAASLRFAVDVIPGDALAVAPDGDLQPPAPPAVTSASSPTPGCARVTWTPGSDPTVVGYVVGYGGQSVEGGEVTHYEFSVDVGAASTTSICSLPSGTWYFAVRAKNYMGMLSAYSTEQPVVIIVVAVLISEFGAEARPDGVHLRWHISADEALSGFRLFRSEAGGPELPVHDSLLPVETDAFVDRTVQPGTHYAYTLVAVREDGDEVPSLPATVTTPALALALEQNAPNPFNPVTAIGFTLPGAARVELDVYDVRGAHVARLSGGVLAAGRHVVEWAGRDDTGAPVASGTYFYTLVTDRRTLSRKMVLLK